MWDKIILGAGLYGLYAALACGRKGQRVLVLERDGEAFGRATYANQARVHMGYHYPRSLSTAKKSAGYFQRFVEDYGFCIHGQFTQVYATSRNFSWTGAREFERFCRDCHIPCEPLPPEAYFSPGLCDGAFRTVEYTYDAGLLKKYFLEQISLYPSVELRFGQRLLSISRSGGEFVLNGQGWEERAPFLLNATYASVNQIKRLAPDLAGEDFGIKYELCEIILCQVDAPLEDLGITVMDGPFFSLMPFGKTGLHSLTSVTFTPHQTSYGVLPEFACMDGEYCSPISLANCLHCPRRPSTAWPYMSALARKYLRPEWGFSYHSSLFCVKPILKASETDDSRPTVIRQSHSSPDFVHVLSGKINTVYDLDGYLGL